MSALSPPPRGAGPGRRTVLLTALVGLPLSGLFFWLAFRNADLDEVWSLLTSAGIGPITLAVAVVAGVYTGQAARWRAIARTPQVPMVRFGEMVVSGVAVNNVLPGRAGDLLRARWLQIAAHIPGGRALATVFVDRSFDVLALVVFLGISLPYVAGADWLLRIALGGLALLAAVGLVLTAARVYTRRRDRGRRSHRSLPRRLVRDTLDGLAEPIGRLRALVLGYGSLAIWAAWGLAAWLVARAVGIELSVADTVFVTAVVNLGVAIPSSPGFVGTYQWLCVSALALFDIGPEQALAFAILMHAVWYLPTTLVGGVLLLRRAFVRLRPGMGRVSRQTTAEGT